LSRRGWTVTATAPARGPVLTDAAAAGHATATLALGGLAKRRGAPALAAWPRARALAKTHDVVYLNGTVCGRLLPALRGSAALTVLHVHDIVDRVPRFWRGADLVLAASQAVADALTPLPVEVVYGPVDPDPPQATPPWPQDGRPVVAYVSRIEPRKAPHDFVAAAPALRASNPDVRIVLVGDDPYDGDPAYAAEVERAAAANAVERYPWTDNAPGLLRHVAVLVLPSQREPFGTVLSEAMAVGTPVVATAVDGLPEVVEDGVTGRLVSPGDPDAIAAAVADVLDRRAEMSPAAGQAAVRFHTPAYVDHVEALIASARQSTGAHA
jgi:glycosyltransferase involved in cell wall biosynthesis